MATARQQLADAWEKLRVSSSSPQAVGDEVGARTAGVGALPLPQAAARVSQAASMVKAEAAKVLKVEDAAEAAAVRATEAVSVVQTAKAAVAAQSAAAKAAADAAGARKSSRSSLGSGSGANGGHCRDENVEWRQDRQ